MANEIACAAMAAMANEIACAASVSLVLSFSLSLSLSLRLSLCLCLSLSLSVSLSMCLSLFIPDIQIFIHTVTFWTRGHQLTSQHLPPLATVEAHSWGTLPRLPSHPFKSHLKATRYFPTSVIGYLILHVTNANHVVDIMTMPYCKPWTRCGGVKHNGPRHKLISATRDQVNTDQVMP